MQALGLLAALAPAQIGIQHLTDNRSGPDDGDLHHDVVKALGPEARQAGHLRAAFHLEQPDGVGFLERGVDQRVVLRQVREINLLRRKIRR